MNNEFSFFGVTFWQSIVSNLFSNTIVVFLGFISPFFIYFLLQRKKIAAFFGITKSNKYKQEQVS